MSTLTKNFKFIKPELTDAADITHTNSNWDILDEELNNMDIPVTSVVPEDSNIWIDPDDNTIEASHLTNKNNPHGVTAAQVGALTMELVWENASPTSTMVNGTEVTMTLNEGDLALVVLRESTSAGAEFSAIGAVGHSIRAIGTFDGKVTRRFITLATTGVTFGKGHIVNDYGSTADDNAKAIPIAIYIMRGVQ